MGVLTNTELEKLSVMYEGDKSRDATDKIRGFLFQDYVMIRCLLQEHVEYVCSEYLEDVDVFYEDGTFEFIQVKYYPKTNPKMKEISTDLYYQHLRLQMLHSTLTAVPRLYIHRNSKVEKPTLEEIIAYCKERNNNVDPQRFHDFYESKGWRVGNQPMKDWKACVRTWEGRDNPPKGSKVATASKYDRED